MREAKLSPIKAPQQAFYGFVDRLTANPSSIKYPASMTPEEIHQAEAENARRITPCLPDDLLTWLRSPTTKVIQSIFMLGVPALFRLRTHP